MNGPGDCNAGTEWHIHEEYCADNVEPDSEICHAFFSGSSDATVGCQSLSHDGVAWLRVVSGGSGTMHVTVTDPTEEVFVDFPYQVGAQVPGFEMVGKEGKWSLEVAFEGARGDATVVLSG